MGIKTVKVLRTISKVVLLVIVLGLVGWGGYYVYRSIAFRPQNIVVTNITDSSATITWTTSSQMNGVVYYKKDKGVLPGPLGIIGSRIGYDDRDVSDAQTACVNEFNKNASETKDENFSVSGENFDCDDARVTGMGKYYTHSVTIKDLDPEGTYYFSMGDGIWSFKSDVSSVKTFALLEEVVEPMPIFGRVLGDDGTYSRDSLVYITFRDGSEETDSVLYSSTTSDDGGWYVDASSIRDAEGNLLPLELGNDTFRIRAKYSNYGESGEVKHVFGYFEVNTFDVVVTKSSSDVESLLNKFVLSAYADNGTPPENCKTCPTWMSEEQVNEIKAGTANCEDIGYGNCLKVFAGDDKKLDAVEAKDMEENGDDTLNGELDYIAGAQNMSNYCNSEGEYCVVNGGCSIQAGKCGQTKAPTGSACESDDVCDDPGACEIVAQGAYMHCLKAGGGCYKWKTNSTKCSTDAASPTSPTSPAEYCTYKGYEYTEGEDCGDSGKTCKNGACIETNAQCSITKWENSCKINCGTSASENVTLHAAWKCQSVYEGYNTMTDTDKVYVSVSELTPWILSVKRIEILVNESTYVQEIAQKELNACEQEHPEVGLIGENNSRGDQCEKICKAMGWSPRTDTTTSPNTYEQCDPTSSQEIGSRFSHLTVLRAYAQDSLENDTYSFYLPEMGLYSFEIDGADTSVVASGDIKMFYIEANGKEGFQPPADFDNPTADEDIVLSANAYEISYEQETSAQEYNIEEGINIVSFDFVPTSTDTGAYMASDVIAQASSNSVDIKYISTFDGGRWYEAYSCANDECTGTDFSIVPGRGYLIYANNAGTITIPGYNLKSSIPVAFSSGWNLVGIHGYTTAYTARTLIDSINNIEGLTANNVSWWPTSKGKYEGLQVENGTEYGLDFAISPTNGYFVRISEFAPTDSKCKSILWNDGGTLNGTCGNTK